MFYALVSPQDEILELRAYDVEPEGREVAANKPRLLPVEDLADTLDPSTQAPADVVITIEAGRVVRFTASRLKTAEEIAAERGLKIGAVMAEATRRLEAAYPLWRQVSLTAEAVALLDIRLEREWTEEEAAKAAVLRGHRAAAAGIRARAAELIATIPQDAAGVYAFDPLAGWD